MSGQSEANKETPREHSTKNNKRQSKLYGKHLQNLTISEKKNEGVRKDSGGGERSI